MHEAWQHHHNAVCLTKQTKEEKQEHHDKQQSRQDNDSGPSRKQEIEINYVFLDIYKFRNRTGYQP